jgi:hypothetical protein
MVDPERQDMRQHRHRQRQRQTGVEHRLRPAQPFRQPSHKQHRTAQSQHRHRDRRDGLCKRLPEQRRENDDYAGKRRIDQPRPMHRHPAVGGVEPMLAQVEPALAREQVAHLDQA